MHAHKLTSLLGALRDAGVQGFILPVNDAHQGEYPPPDARRLEWLTGFSGSAGMVAVLDVSARENPAKAGAIFTDGRYTLQVVQESDESLFDFFNSADMSPEQWLVDSLKPNSIIGYDPWLFTGRVIARFEQAGERKHITFKPMASNPVDALWNDRPPASQTPAELHDIRYSGQSSEEKRRDIAAQMAKKKLDAALLTTPESINWLLNIRGHDVPNTPVVLCFALLEANGKVTVYADEQKISQNIRQALGSDVKFTPLDNMASDMGRMKGKRVLYDAIGSSIWFAHTLQRVGAVVQDGQDPCLLPKACKNKIELSNIRAAHVQDGAALSGLLCWIDAQIAGGNRITELDVMQKAEQFRGSNQDFRYPSFTTIAGSGPNGAIVHYRANELSNRPLEMNSLFLLDSGGQYPGGTTDVTRTIAIGTPSDEMKDRFTRVLKGHIALAMAVFPAGTSGGQLDVLARNSLWQAGLDYDHGTGHGVGQYLSVHEGPQRISKRGGDVPLQPGMIISNEPGFYKTGEYGIRIENLVAVVEKLESSIHGRTFLGFDTLTLVPIDTSLVIKEMLSGQEQDWLNAYHARVLQTLSPLVGGETKQWLERRCQSL